MCTVQPVESLTGQPLYFRLAPEYRRCGIYGLVGFLVVLGTAILLIWIDHGFQRNRVRDLLGMLPLFMFLAPYLIWSVILLRWRLRVDDRGIARQRFWRWDAWPWEVFADGQVYSGSSSLSFEYPEKPWCHRILLLHVLAKDDAMLLGDLIKKIWKPPPVPAVEEITIDYFAHGKKRVRFHRQGIDVRVNAREYFYPWSAVQKLRITRVDHNCRDFRRLEMLLPEQSMRLRDFRHDLRCRTKTEAREIIAALLLNHVPPDRAVIIACRGPPRSLEECSERLTKLNRQIREHSCVRWFCWCMLAALYSLPMIFGDWKLVWTAIVPTGLVFLLLWALRQNDEELSRKRAEMEAWESATPTTSSVG